MDDVNFWKVSLFELCFVVFCMTALGFIKKPRFLMKRRLVKGFPWGYYADQVPQGDPNMWQGSDTDFLHDTGTGFGGLDGFGDYGEFSGFGQLGEYGAGFGAGGGGDISGG